MDQIAELEARLRAFQSRLVRFLSDLGDLAPAQYRLVEEAAGIAMELEAARSGSVAESDLSPAKPLPC